MIDINKIASINLLRAIDIELISVLKEKLLYPKTVEEFFVTIEALDKDKEVLDKLSLHFSNTYYTLTDYYGTQDKDTINILIRNI